MPQLKDRPKTMKMAEVRAKAQYLGIVLGKMKKTELIRAIQSTEGCWPCFGTANGECTNKVCCFWSDCKKMRD